MHLHWAKANAKLKFVCDICRYFFWTTQNSQLKRSESDVAFFFTFDRGATDTPFLDFCWRLPWVSKPGWIPCRLSRLCDPQIHLWCDTCWLYRGQHGSWAFSIHILADMSVSIGRGWGPRLKPMTVSAARSKHHAVNHSATPAWLSLTTT